MSLKRWPAHRTTPNCLISKLFFKPSKTTLQLPSDQFRKYLAALLGYKHQERVLDVMSKVDKSVRRSAPALPPPSQFPAPNQGYRGAFSSVQCFYCGKLGHIQSRCFKRLSDLQFKAGPSKRFKSDRPGQTLNLRYEGELVFFSS